MGDAMYEPQGKDCAMLCQSVTSTGVKVVGEGLVVIVAVVLVVEIVGVGVGKW